VIPTWNSVATLRFAIESARRQTFRDFEIVVVGDGCTDGTADFLASLGDGRIRWTNLPLNSGSQAAPNNAGLRLARGRLIAYLGHDDLWLPHHLDGLVRAAETSGVDLVHSACAMFEPSGVFAVLGVPRPPGRIPDFVPPSTWIHRADAAGRFGFWRNPAALGWPVDDDVLRQIHRAGGRIHAHTQVSVLKFPSARWGLYSRRADWPQEPWWRSIHEDPAAVERRILYEVARFADRAATPDVRGLYWAARRSGSRMLRVTWGDDRWPLGPWLQARYRQHRRRNRAARGLPLAWLAWLLVR
jgi:glycosyltransferase involved in cell wall biosynthesis